MAVIVGEAAVRLRPETSTFAGEAESEVDRSLPGVAKKAAGFFAAAFAAVKIGQFLGDAIGQATDLGENISKAGVVFGPASAQIEAFASTASTALGQSRNQALEAAGSFGSLFVGMGIGQQQAADMSTRMVTLASDMASFGNSTPQEALDALRSGLVGEAEPLRRFGVMLNAASIEQEAMRLGLMQSGGELTEAAKAQAVYSLAIQQTGIQTGDFGRTSAGLANQQRILTAQFTDLSTNIGGLFVPALALGAQAVTGGIMPTLLRLTSGLADAGATFGSFFDYARAGFAGTDTAGFVAAQSAIGERFQMLALDAGNAGAIFGEAFADGRVGAELFASEGLGGLAARAGVAAFTIRDSFGSAFLDLQNRLAPVFAGLMDAVGPALSEIGAAFSGMFAGLGGEGGGLAGFASTIGTVLNALTPIISGVIEHYVAIFQAVLPAITTAITALVPVITGLITQLQPVFAAIIPIVQQVSGVFAETLGTVIQALLPVIPVLVQALGQVASVLAGAFLTVLQSLAPVLPVLIGAIGQIAGILAGAFAQALTAIAPVLPVIANVIGQVAGMLAGALATALQAILPVLPPIIDAFAQIALVLVGVLMQALSAILPIIPTLVQALLALVQAALLPLLPMLPMIAALFMMIVTALAPLIPPIIQLVAIIIQLAIAAIMPLMPLIPTLIGLFMLLMQILMPIIQIVVGIVGAFVGMASTVATVVFGFVSTVIGVFTSFWSGITTLVSRIVGGVTGGFQGLYNGVVGIFTGIADFVGGMFEGIGGAIKTAINAVISGINNTVIAGLNLVIDGVNVVNPFDDIPHIPKIPRFHEGGLAQFGPAGQGLALLRDAELVATPEQQRLANDLLSQLLTGALPGAAPGTAAAGRGVTVVNNVSQQPGEDGSTLAARVTQGVVWNLNAGITRRVGAGAEVLS